MSNDSTMETTIGTVLSSVSDRGVGGCVIPREDTTVDVNSLSLENGTIRLLLAVHIPSLAEVNRVSLVLIGVGILPLSTSASMLEK